MHFYAKLLHSRLLKGTIILTSASFLTRIIGFLYRIYIAQYFHEEGMGIIQLSFPIVILFFSICAAGTQAAISRFTAANHNSIVYFCAGTLLGFIISIGCALFLYMKADWIAISLLKEIRCAPLLRIHALSLPFSTLHACLNGYFIGIEKSSYTAISQIIEQFVRVGSVYLFISIALSLHHQLSLAIVVLGSFLGEIVSSIFSFFMLLFYIHALSKTNKLPYLNPQKYKIYFSIFINANKKILSHAVPITFNRILVNCLNSLEATMIPQQLVLFGLSNSNALAAYGVLTGMALPLILFPASFTNAICILLLPRVAKEQALNNRNSLKRILYISTFSCLSMGIISGLFFVPFGNFLGNFMFHSQQAGYYIHILGFFCPILYLPTVLSTILNGLGLVKKTLMHHVLTISIRLLFVKWCIPKYSLQGYLLGLFISQLLLTSLNFLALYKYIVYNETGLSEITTRRESHHGI